MSTYRPYPKTKPSGVEWLGDVPVGWEVVPLFADFRRIKQTGFADLELLSVYRDYGVIPKSSRDDNFNKESDDLNSYQRVQKGDLVLNKMKAWQGSIGVSNHEGIVSPAYFTYRPNPGSKRFDPLFLHHLVRSLEYTAYYLSRSKGIRVNQWDLDPDEFRSTPLLCPPLPEQIQIAAFLDRECGKLDALQAKQERLIDLLKEKRQALISHTVTKGLDPNAKLKPSGIEWLGDVPVGWVVTRLKFVATIQTGIAKGKDNAGRTTIAVPYLRVANVQDGYLALDDVATMEIPIEDLPRYSLRPGDVLMNEGGDFDKLGRGHVWRGEIEPCIHQNHVFAIRPTSVSCEWLSALTSANYAQFYFMSRSKQSTNLASLSSTNLMELPVLHPPLPEQRAIVAYLDDKCGRMDALIAKAERAIALLKERRTALISAAVTGKIDVRDV